MMSEKWSYTSTGWEPVMGKLCWVELEEKAMYLPEGCQAG